MEERERERERERESREREREREREKDERGGYNIVKSVITDNKFKSQRFDQSARNCACRRKDEKSSSSFTYPISRVVNHKAQLV